MSDQRDIEGVIECDAPGCGQFYLRHVGDTTHPKGWLTECRFKMGGEGEAVTETLCPDHAPPLWEVQR